MSFKTKCSIFFLSVFTVSLMVLCMWHVIHNRDIQKTLDNFRRRRTAQNNSTTTISPEQMEITKALNKTQNREMENVLEVTLAKLLITSPEDIMTSFVTRENFGCKDLRHSLKVFSANYNGDLRSDLVYVRLFRSVGKFCQHFCGQDEKYRKLFTPYQDELFKIQEAFEDCQGRLDWYEKNSSFACEEANKIIECTHVVLASAINAKVDYHYIEIFEKIMNEAMSDPCIFSELKLTKCEMEAIKQQIDWMLIIMVVTFMISFLLCCCLFRKKLVT